MPANPAGLNIRVKSDHVPSTSLHIVPLIWHQPGLVSLYALGVAADGNDWVDPAFVLKKNGMPNAQNRIINFAKSTASNGPWTVSGGTTILPPNGDKRDYLSWAPYHWPNCNWCTGGRAHLATGGNRTDSENSGDGSNSDSNTSANTYDDGAPENSGEDSGGDDGSSDDGIMIPDPSETYLPVPTSITVPIAQRKMIKRVRSFADSEQQGALLVDGYAPNLPSILATTVIPEAEPTSTEDNVANGSTGVQNARKTQTQQHAKTTGTPKGKTTQKGAATKTAGGGGSDCTPSPTKSLAPSATWTTCKYVVKDGHVNPDVRDITGVSNVADAAQSILYNAAAAVLAGSQDYSQTAVQFIQAFFLDSKNGMHPRVAYGQVIRGPGIQDGQYLGIIDLRGMVKVSNAVQIMRTAKDPAWTSALDAQMVNWAAQYVKWMQTDSLGQKALSAPNNHGSFATNQLAAVNILVQDPGAAGTALKAYFANQFQDQIAASGEQPFEAVRTRPFHYRCFNLEAMITNAKLGDQLGLNFWTTKSKYGANIKDALDFVLAKGPGNEDIADIFPHVAAIAAAYGDPNGKYASYLKQKDPRYQVSAYYFYDQPAALTRAPASPKSKAEQEILGLAEQLEDFEDLAQSLEATEQPTPTSLPIATPTIPWECPVAFATQTRVELDDGVYVTCDELKPLYGYADETGDDV
ncbi:hypothetical protein ACEPAH_9411 [Sanghuangporus vaninii]